MLAIAHSPMNAPRMSATRRSKDAGVKLRVKIKIESLEQEILAMNRIVAAYSAWTHSID